MGKSRFKVILICFSLFFNSFLSSGQITADYQVNFGVPIALSSTANSFLSDTLKLSNSIPVGLVVGCRLIGAKGWFGSVSGVFSGFSFKNDSIDVAINQRFALFGVGKQFELSEKWHVGLSLGVGITRSVQIISKTKPSSTDIWMSYDANQFDEFGQISQITKIKFASQIDVYADYRVSPVFDFSVGFRNSISSMKNLDQIHNKPLYRNYFMPFVGVRIHWKERKE
jgi:hypothetical protein